MSDQLVDTIKSELSGLKSIIDQKIEKASEAQKAQSEATVSDIKSEVSNLVEKHNTLQEQIDKFESASQRLEGIKESNKGWAEKALDSAIANANGNFLSRVKEGGVYSKNVLVKAETVISSASDLLANSPTTNDVVMAQRGVSGIQYDPLRDFRVRSIFQQFSTTSNKIDWVEENAYSDGTAWKAEGTAVDPNSHFDLQRKSIAIEEFGTYFRIPRTMLEDIDGMRPYITSRLQEHWGEYEDGLLLSGTNASTPDHLGVLEVASAYTDVLADTNVNRFDVLAMAIKQVRDGNYNPNVILVTTDDYYTMLLEKGTDGHYVMPDTIRLGMSIPTVAGVPIIATNAMPADTFLVGDTRKGSGLFDREAGNVRFFEQDQNNAIRGLVTITINARLGLANWRPNAYVTGTFGAALATGSA